jgi:5-methylcytosine-specific restriction endonuclease McrA
MSKREELFSTQHGKCFWCGFDMLPLGLGEALPRSCTVDHVIPKVAGGLGSSTNNLVAACYECNHLRGLYNTGQWKIETAKYRREIRELKEKVGNKVSAVAALKDLIIDKEQRIQQLTGILLRYVGLPWWKKFFRLPVSGN